MTTEVQYITHMGDDRLVVNAARVSFAKEVEQFREDEDGRLVKYLATHNHWSPFAHPQVCMRIKMPIFVARQWFKHTVGVAYNEMSRRYVDDEPEFFTPPAWRGRPDGTIKQGSGAVLNGYHQDECNELHDDALYYCTKAYTGLLASGVCPEQARMVLPQCAMTEFYETASLYAWARIYNQRIDSHAQYETQQYAKAVDAIVRPLFPVSWEALCGPASGVILPSDPYDGHDPGDECRSARR